MTGESTKERFDEKWMPEPNSGCWLWAAASSSEGRYGCMRVGDTMRQAHRVAWQIYKGTIPPGMVVCHKCDTTHCVNPDHLFLGTQAENIADMDFKRRRGITSHAPDDPPHSKLSPNQIPEVRRLCRSGIGQKKIAKMFGITQSAVSNINTGRSWVGIEDTAETLRMDAVKHALL